MIKGFVLALLVSIAANGDISVEDPHDYLSFISGTFSLSLNDSFSCQNEQATFRRGLLGCHFNCKGLGCRALCTPAPPEARTYSLFAEDCSDGLVHLYGSHGLYLEITESEFAQGKNTLLIPMLKTLNDYITPNFRRVVINQVRHLPIQVFKEGRVISEDAVVIKGSLFVPGSTHGVSFSTWFSPTRKGIHQVLLVIFSEDNIVLKQDGVIHVPTFP